MKDTGRAVKAEWSGTLTCPAGSLDLSQAGSLRKVAGEKGPESQGWAGDGQESFAYGISDQRGFGVTRHGG